MEYAGLARVLFEDISHHGATHHGQGNSPPSIITQPKPMEVLQNLRRSGRLAMGRHAPPPEGLAKWGPSSPRHQLARAPVSMLSLHFQRERSTSFSGDDSQHTVESKSSRELEEEKQQQQ